MSSFENPQYHAQSFFSVRPAMSNPALYISLFFWCFVLCPVRAQNDTANSSSCHAGFEYLHSNKPVNISQQCSEGQCIAKCCPDKQILFKNGSETNCKDILILKRDYNVTGLDDFSKALVFRDNVRRKIVQSMKKISNFTFIFSRKFTDPHPHCVIIKMLEDLPEPAYLIYLTESGNLSIRRVNYVDPWFEDTKPGDFCIDHRLELKDDGTLLSSTPKVAYRAVYHNDGEIKSTMGYAKLSVYGMLISCFFMSLVLVVYALLPELRNLAGLMLMAYVATLTATFLSRSVQVLANNDKLLDTTGCAVVGLIVVYTLMSSFCWMSVMSFDIWWSMRGFRKVRRIHRRGILVKFGWYCLYGWGAPLVPTLFIIIVEYLDLTHLPNFVKPHLIFPDGSTCFFNEDERQLYVNAPILIMTVTNIVLFLMTAYNIWRIQHGVTQYSAGDSKQNNEDRHRFSLYLKLSLVMGISWVLEVVSSLVYPTSPVWIITDAYNVLIGTFIFFIFVFKKKIFVLLCRKFSIENKWTDKWQRTVGSTKTMSKGADKKRTMDSVTESSDSGDPSSMSKVSYNCK